MKFHTPASLAGATGYLRAKAHQGLLPRPVQPGQGRPRPAGVWSMSNFLMVLLSRPRDLVSVYRDGVPASPGMQRRNIRRAGSGPGQAVRRRRRAHRPPRTGLSSSVRVRESGPGGLTEW